MTPKQTRFVAEYLIDLNATQAAIRAGYAKPRASEQGYQLLRKPTVQAAIAKQVAKQAKRLEISQDMVLNGLRENFERAMEHEPVTDRDGNPTGEYIYNGSVANRALELLGKHLGMFVDKSEIKHSGEISHKPDLDNLTDKELEQIERILDNAGRREEREGEGQPGTVH